MNLIKYLLLFMLFTINNAYADPDMTYNFFAETHVTVHLVNQLANNQKIFYKIIDNKSNQLVVHPTIISFDLNNSSDLPNISFVRRNIDSSLDNLMTNFNSIESKEPMDYTVIIYGMKYKEYQVAYPIRLTFDSHQLFVERASREAWDSYLKGDFKATANYANLSPNIKVSIYRWHTGSGFNNHNQIYANLGDEKFFWWPVGIKTDIVIDIQPQLTSFISLVSNRPEAHIIDEYKFLGKP